MSEYTPANAHLSRVTPKSQGSLLAPAQTLLTHNRQAEALELRCPGKVHDPPATTTTGVKTQPKARPKQGPRSPEPVLRL